MTDILSPALAQAIGEIIKELRSDVHERISEVTRSLRHSTTISDERFDEIDDSLSKYSADFVSEFDALRAELEGLDAQIEKAVESAFGQAMTLVDERVERSQLENDLFLERAKNALSEIKQMWSRETDSLNKLQLIDGRRTFMPGSFGTMGGSIYRALTETKEVPDDDPGAWDLISAGVDDIEIMREGRNTYVVFIIGGERRALLVDRTIEFKGGHKKNGLYQYNDCVMKDGATWICVADRTDIEPGTKTDKPVWRLLSMRGMKGDKGERGAKGAMGIAGKDGQPGVGILDVQQSGLNVAIALSDGSVKSLDLSLVVPELQELVDARIRELTKPKTVELV